MSEKQYVYFDVKRTQFIGKDKPAKELISAHHSDTHGDFWSVELPYGMKCKVTDPTTNEQTTQDVSGYRFTTSYEPTEPKSSYENYRKNYAHVSFPEGWNITLEKSKKENGEFVTQKLRATPADLNQAFSEYKHQRQQRAQQAQSPHSLQEDIAAAKHAASQIPVLTFDMHEAASHTL